MDGDSNEKVSHARTVVTVSFPFPTRPLLPLPLSDYTTVPPADAHDDPASHHVHDGHDDSDTPHGGRSQQSHDHQQERQQQRGINSIQGQAVRAENYGQQVAPQQRDATQERKMRGQKRRRAASGEAELQEGGGPQRRVRNTALIHRNAAPSRERLLERRIRRLEQENAQLQEKLEKYDAIDDLLRGDLDTAGYQIADQQETIQDLQHQLELERQHSRTLGRDLVVAQEQVRLTQGSIAAMLSELQNASERALHNTRLDPLELL